VLLKVPRTLVLDSQVVKELNVNVEALEADKFHVHEENYWIVWRLYQLKCANGGNASFAPWINAMPQAFETFTKDEIDCLPFYARYAAEYQEAKFASFCNAAAVMKDEDCVFDPANSDHVALLKWAFNAVNSRFWKTNPSENAKNIKQTSELVPLGDMFNHRDPPNVQMIPEDSDYVTFAYKGDDDDDDEDNSTNEKDIFISYGQPSNPHRFLVIFKFSPRAEYMPKLWSHLSYSPTNPYASDFDGMVFDSRTGNVSQTVWDAILWELSEPPSQELYLSFRDKNLMTHKGLLEEVLLNHINQQLEELATCREKISMLDSGSAPNLDVIRQHNDFLTEVFTKVKNNPDNWTTMR